MPRFERRSLFVFTAVLGFVLAACTPQGIRSEQAPRGVPEQEPERATSPGSGTVDTPTPSSESCEDPFEGERVQFPTRYWEKTNFCKHSVPYSEIQSGGPPPDGIPAIDAPVFESVEAADTWLGAEWPVMILEWEGDVRAYPLAILIWHEIVNDTVGGKPVAVTFCPLCNSTLVFDRRLPDGTVLDFGTTGNLRFSDLVMYDRQTESWWQQLTGEAIVGDLLGTRLQILPSQIIAWSDFRDSFPDAKVLSRETGYNRDYGRNPYVGYDSASSPFLFADQPDDRLPAMERVVTVTMEDEAAAYPFDALRDVEVVNDELGGVPIVVFWKAGTASSLDASSFTDSKDVGSTGVFRRELEGQALTFEAVGEGRFRDQETGTTWDIFGEALEGPLAGAELTAMVSGEYFWFSWAAFKPDTRVWSSGE